MEFYGRGGFFFTCPCGVEAQPAGAAGGVADPAHFGALVVTEGAAKFAGMVGEAVGEEAGEEDFYLPVHMGGEAVTMLPGRRCNLPAHSGERIQRVTNSAAKLL